MRQKGRQGNDATGAGVVEPGVCYYLVGDLLETERFRENGWSTRVSPARSSTVR